MLHIEVIKDSTDFADLLYKACASRMADMEVNSDELNETVLDRAYVTIGNYTYTRDQYGRLCMFPYGKVEMGFSYVMKTKWLEGVIVDETDNSGQYIAKQGFAGFPLSRLISVIDDMLNVQDIMRQSGISWRTN